MIFLIVSIFIYEQRELKFRSKDRNLHVAKGNCAIDAAVNFAIRNRRQRNLVHLTPGLEQCSPPRMSKSHFPTPRFLFRILAYFFRLFGNAQNAVHVPTCPIIRALAAFGNILDAQISWVGLQNSNPVHPSA